MRAVGISINAHVSVAMVLMVNIVSNTPSDSLPLKSKQNGQVKDE